MDQERNLPSATLFDRSPAQSQRTKLKASDVERFFARLTAAYGEDKRVADEASRALLRREWIEALGHHEPHAVNAALGRVIRTSKFWPSIAEVLAACEPSDYRTHEERFGKRLRAGPRISRDFCRDGRTVEQEIEHRKHVVSNIKRAWGWTPAFDYVPPQPATLDTGVQTQYETSDEQD